MVGAADRGLASQEIRHHPLRAGDHYILGERLRAGATELARPSPYRQAADNLAVIEVHIPDDVGSRDRFVVCFDCPTEPRAPAVIAACTPVCV